MLLFVKYAGMFLLFCTMVYVAIRDTQNDYKGKQIKKVVLSYIVLGFLGMLIFLIRFYGNLQFYWIGLLNGLILVYPFYFLTKYFIKKNLEGTTLFYKSYEIKKIIAGIFIGFIMGVGFKQAGIVDKILEAALLSGCFSLFCSQLITLKFIAQLEKRLGAPIIGDFKS